MSCYPLTLLSTRLRVAAFVLFVVLAAGALGYYCLQVFIALQTTPSLSPRESAFHETRELMNWVRLNPTGDRPANMPGYLLGGARCWSFLQAEMTRNNSAYNLDLKSIYDSTYDPHAFHDMVEVYLNVKFPDGRVAEIYYSQGGLTGCRVLK